MKSFYVTINGQERQLRYSSEDGVALKRRFGKSLLRLIQEDVMSIGIIGRKPAVTGDFDRETQVAFVLAGLHRAGYQIPESKLMAAIDKHCGPKDGDHGGGKIGDFVMPAVRAAFYAGVVTGSSLDLDTVEEDPEDAEGNEQPTGETPQA